MKKFFTVALMILFAANICRAAPASIDKTTANFQARQSFMLTSAEGDKYDVYIIGEDEKILYDWLWAQGDKIFSGNYFAYINKINSATLNLQDVKLFADIHSAENAQRVNVTQLDRDGFYRVKCRGNLPDLLVSKIQITGGGAFAVKIFVVKDGRLQQVKFIGDKFNGNVGKIQDSRDSTSNPIICNDDGTISVPWHSNVAGIAGSYITVYMLDVDNLILSPAYTNKL
ncbi:MAG: hypothetical protein IJS69_04250 [Selenomonadaceae bacterium]|nr:hypothetical protein [Selenomonadaceae bacterium]